MLLIDRKMPESCIDCVCNDDDYRCNMTGDELDYDIAWIGRMPNCPLKEYDRKTGKWIWKTGDVYRCSECETDVHVAECMGKPIYNFCPYCGAPKMEGEEP